MAVTWERVTRDDVLRATVAVLGKLGFAVEAKPRP